MSEFTGLRAGSFQKVLFNEELLLADPRGAPRTPPSVQFLSFSCSFRQNFCQIIGICPRRRGWRLPIWEILDSPLITPPKNQTSIQNIPKNQKDDVFLV